MPDCFEGKVALITGGSRGLGYALAARLAGRGAKLVITARGAERLADSLGKLRKITPHVVSAAGDVSRWEDARRMVRTAVEEFGRLDILINNAGISMRGRLSELTPDVCKRVIDTNLYGSLYPTMAAADRLIESRGQVIFISSIAGIFGLPGNAPYCASKGALTGLCESLRCELEPLGVHAGIVYLGFTEHDPEKRILAADGAPLLPDRPAHHTQDQAARLILGMMEKRRKKIVLTPLGKLGWFAYRLSPWLVEKSILMAQASRWGLFKRFS